MFNKIKIKNYAPLIPPFGKCYEEKGITELLTYTDKLTKSQAEEHFQWFISHIDDRCEYLIERCSKDLKIHKSELNYSPESLLPLYNLYLKWEKKI